MSKVIRYDCRSNEEWRRERCHSIGASAVGTILGVNRFESPSQLAFKMREELQGRFDYRQNTAMRRGHYYEGGVAQYFSDETGHEIIASSATEYLVRRTDIPYIHVSPDRIYWLDNDGPKHGKIAETNKGVLECKTTRKAVKKNKLPLGWLLQLQTQMGVTGYHKGAIAWDVLSKSEGFGYAKFDFNEEVFAAIDEVCKEFWYRSVIDGQRPHENRYYTKRYPCLFFGSWKDTKAKEIKEEVVAVVEEEEEETTEESSKSTGCVNTLTWFENLIKTISE